MRGWGQSEEKGKHEEGNCWYRSTQLLGLYAPVLAAPIHRCLGIEATIVGTNGPDVVKGTQGDDVIVRRDGDDRISGLSGDDTLCGGRGADVVHARSKQSFDKECGGGDYGDEALSGGKGNDRLFGGGYLIYMAGNRGNDLLDGCNRLDLSGVGFGSARGPVTVNLKKGFAKGEGCDTLRYINYVVGSTFGDTIIGSNYPVKIIDTSYSELLVGGGGNDKVSGLQGPDEILRWEWCRQPLGSRRRSG